MKNYKFKEMYKSIVLLLMVFLLSGCMQADMGVTVKSEDEVEVNYKILMSPLALSDDTSFGTLEEDNDTETTLENPKEEISKNLREDFDEDTLDNVDIKDIEEEVNGDTWYGIEVHGNIPEEKLDDVLKVEESNGKRKLVFTFSSDETEDMMSSMEGNADTSTISGSTEIEYDEQTVSMMKAMGMKVKLKITMPNEPTTNFGEVNGNTVEVDLLSVDYLNAKNQDIVVSCDYPETEVLHSGNADKDLDSGFKNDGISKIEERSNLIKIISISACGLLFLVVVIVVIVVLRKNKSKKPNNGYINDNFYQDYMEKDINRQMDMDRSRQMNIDRDRQMNMDRDRQMNMEHQNVRNRHDDLNFSQGYVPPHEKEERKAKFCPHCGNPLNENDEKCRYCGYKIWK